MCQQTNTSPLPPPPKNSLSKNIYFLNVKKNDWIVPNYDENIEERDKVMKPMHRGEDKKKKKPKKNKKKQKKLLKKRNELVVKCRQENKF